MRDPSNETTCELPAVPFAIAVPSNARNVASTPEEMSEKKQELERYFKRHDHLLMNSTDYQTPFPDIVDTPYDTIVHDENREFTQTDSNQDSITTYILDSKIDDN